MEKKKINKEDIEYYRLLIDWRTSMCKGRARPNRHAKEPGASGYIMDSLESIGNIARVDAVLEENLLPDWDEFSLSPRVMAFGKKNKE